MPSLNKVLLIGNCTRDPELRYTQKGAAVCDVGLAVNRTWKDPDGNKQEETTFIDVTFFGRTAEVAGEYLRKGVPVFIEGRLQLDQWDDKQTGQKRTKLKVVGDSMQMLGGKSDRAEERQERGFERRESAPAPKPRDVDIDEDIPF